MKAMLRTRAWTTAFFPQAFWGLAALLLLKKRAQRCCSAGCDRIVTKRKFSSAAAGIQLSRVRTYCARKYFVTARSEEHTSELQSLMRISYAVFCLKKKKHNPKTQNQSTNT